MIAIMLRKTIGLWYVHRDIASHDLSLHSSLLSQSLSFFVAQGIAKQVAKLKKSKIAAIHPVIIVMFIFLVLVVFV